MFRKLSMFQLLFCMGLLQPQRLRIFLSHLASSIFLTCLILGWVGALLSRAAVAAPPLFITIQPTLSDPGQLPLLCNATDGAGEEKDKKLIALLLQNSSVIYFFCKSLTLADWAICPLLTARERDSRRMCGGSFNAPCHGWNHYNSATKTSMAKN